MWKALTSFISNLRRRRRLLVILGAGSSVQQGMPSVATINSLMRSWASTWYRLPGHEDYFNEIWRNLETYYAGGSSPFHPKPNFEMVLGEMLTLAYWMAPQPFGDPFRQITSNMAPPTNLNFAFPTDPYGNAAAIAVNTQLTYLLKQLAKYMRQQCLSLNTATSSFHSYRQIITILLKYFDIGIYNLNYDVAALKAFPGAFTGFTAGRFDRKAVHSGAPRNFIYHLHGSVHHTLIEPFGETALWQDDLSGDFDDGEEGRSTDPRSEGRPFPRTSLIAGGYKLDQILVEPYQSFYSSLVRDVQLADAILFGGYGFGDEHVNRAFRNRFERPGDRPRAAILTWSPDTEDPMEWRRDTWSHNLHITLNVGNEFRWPGHAAAPAVSELKSHKAFEVCAAEGVAIWHGGFVEASSQIEELARWLGSKAANAALAGH